MLFKMRNRRFALDELVTGAEVARRFGFSRERLRQLLEGPDFPRPIGRVGQAMVWRWDDLDRWAQPAFEVHSAGATFRTIRHRPGFIEVNEGNGKWRTAGVWPRSKIMALEPDPDGVIVRSGRKRGRVVKNNKDLWTLAEGRTLAEAPRSSGR
jgi:predicted DNA-binding transcriptional regulator AlpA